MIGIEIHQAFNRKTLERVKKLNFNLLSKPTIGKSILGGVSHVIKSPRGGQETEYALTCARYAEVTRIIANKSNFEGISQPIEIDK